MVTTIDTIKVHPHQAIAKWDQEQNGYHNEQFVSHQEIFHWFESCLFTCPQGGHSTGKMGNLVLTFSRQGKHRKFCSDTGKNLLTQGKYLDCDYEHKKYVYFLISKIFSLALLGIIFNFKVLCTFVPICYVSQFYPCIYSLPQYIHA